MDNGTIINNNYKIRKTDYFIEILRLSDERLERIRKRKASKNLQCCECDEEIPKGDIYIRDIFKPLNYESEYYYKRSNKICLTCWKGEVPLKLSTNWKR